jgi:predicted 2-oxoglutarate/Fe(II)-dependent dioxygenase YbiX
MILGPAIKQYDFPQTLAKDLVQLFENDEEINWNKSKVGNNKNNRESEIRTSSEFLFENEMPIAAGKVKEIFVNCVNDYINEFNIPITQDEKLNLLRYEKSDKYDYHADASWDLYRTSSALIYLNPGDYEGGETHFKLFDIKVKPQNPSIVLFPANYAYVHSALPVTSGVKYVLVTWMNDLPIGFSPQIISDLAIITGK